VRPLDRRSHIAALAGALKVSETDLVGGPHLSADPQQADPHMSIPALRVALQTNTLASPALDRAPPVADVVATLKDQVQPSFFACDYVRLGQLLPPVIDELHCHAAAPGGVDREQALRALVEACAFGALRAKDLGYPDLAHLAAARAAEAAT